MNPQIPMAGQPPHHRVWDFAETGLERRSIRNKWNDMPGNGGVDRVGGSGGAFEQGLLRFNKSGQFGKRNARIARRARHQGIYVRNANRNVAPQTGNERHFATKAAIAVFIGRTAHK